MPWHSCFLLHSHYSNCFGTSIIFIERVIDALPKSDVVIYSSQEIEEYLLNNLEE